MNARLDLVGHARIEDVPGRALDVEGTLALIADAERTEHTVVALWTREVPAAVTSKMLRGCRCLKGGWQLRYGLFQKVPIPRHESQEGCRVPEWHCDRSR